MAQSKLTCICEWPGGQYRPGCPVAISAGSLWRQGMGPVFARLTFTSLSETRIAALVVHIDALDAQGNRVSLAATDFQYPGLNAEPYQDFGGASPIPLGCCDVRNLRASVVSVDFADGSHWKTDNATPAPTPAPEPLPLTDELLAAYRRELGSDALRFSPLALDGAWRCGCGAWNPQGRDCCRICGASLSRQQALADMDVLRPIAQAQLAAIAEERTRAAQKAALQKQRRQKRKRTAILASAVSLAVLGAFVFLLLTQIIPKSHYSEGLRLSESAQALNSANLYARAYDEFAAAKNYSDAPRRAETAAGHAADAFAAERNYSTAATYYRYAGNEARIYECWHLNSISDADTVRTASGFLRFSSKYSDVLYSRYVGFENDPVDYSRYTGADGREYTLVFDDRAAVSPFGNDDFASVSGVTGIQDEDGNVIAFDGYDARIDYRKDENGQKTLEAIWLSKDRLYGLAAEDGTVLMEPSVGFQKFESYGRELPRFFENIAVVRKDGLWGAIDRNGQFVIEPQYGRLYDASEGLVLAQLPDSMQMINGLYTSVEGDWLVLDTQGNILLRSDGWKPGSYSYRFSHGWLQVDFSDKEEGYINREGRRFLDRTWRFADLICGSIETADTDILDMDAERIIGNLKDSYHYEALSCGLVYESYNSWNSGRDLYNFSGTLLLENVNSTDDYLANPFYMISYRYLLVDDAKNGKGLYELRGSLSNRSLRLITAVQWDFLCGANKSYLASNPANTCGLISVGKESYRSNSYGFIDLNGQFVSDGLCFRSVCDFTSDGVAIVQTQDELYGLLNTKGEMAVEAAYQSIQRVSENLYAVENANGKWGLMNTEGKVLVECRYSEIGSFTNGRIFVKDGSYWKLIELDGTVCLERIQDYRITADGTLALERDNRWGVVESDLTQVF